MGPNGRGEGQARGVAQGAERQRGTRAPLPPDARDGGPSRGADGGGRHLLGAFGIRGPVAGGASRGSGGACRADGGALSPRADRDRAVPALRRRARRRASGAGRSPDAALQQRRADRGRSLPAGAGGARGEPDAERGGPHPRGRAPAGTAAPGGRDRSGYGIRDRGGAAGAPRRALRLHVHRHLGGFLLGSGGTLRRWRGMHRVPPARYREGPCRTGLRPPRL